MTGAMAALGGFVLAVLIAAGAWLLARKGRPLVGGPPAQPASPLAQPPLERAQVIESEKAPSEAEADPDDGFDYAPELRPQPAVGATERDGKAFEETFAWQRLRRDLEILEHKVDAQQRVIAALQAEVDGLREQLSAASSPREVSPEYDAALVYARQGMAAAGIAERCGITLAEAELVCAMATK